MTEAKLTRAADLAAALGYPLAECRLLGRGQNRTARGRTVDGTEVIVKWGLDEDWEFVVRRGAEMSQELRRRGYPAPPTLAHGPAGDAGYGWVLAVLPGAPAGPPDSALLRQVLEAVELQADATPAHRDACRGWSWTDAATYDDHAGWWRAADAQGGVVAEVAGRLRRWLEEVPRAAPSTRDYVHLDLNFCNLLSVGNRLTGIVDLDTLGVGDRAVDLAYLALQYAGAAHDSGVTGMPDGFCRLREEAHRISGTPGWRHGLAYSCIGWLGWSNPEGMHIDRGKAAATITAILDTEQAPG